MALCGAFKAVVVTSSLKSDLKTGDFTSKFGFRVMAEPKVTDFQFQSPLAYSTEDDKGNEVSCSTVPNAYWQEAMSSQMDFTHEWTAMDIPLKSKSVGSFRKLEIQVPIRTVISKNQISFPCPLTEDVCEIKKNGLTFKLNSFDALENSVTGNLAVHDFPSTTWGSPGFDFYLEQDGERVAQLYSSSTSTSMSGDTVSMEFTLAGRFIRNWQHDEPCELLIFWPDKTSEETLLFEFRDVPLPVLGQEAESCDESTALKEPTDSSIDQG